MNPNKAAGVLGGRRVYSSACGESMKAMTGDSASSFIDIFIQTTGFLTGKFPNERKAWTRGIFDGLFSLVWQRAIAGRNKDEKIKMTKLTKLAWSAVFFAVASNGLTVPAGNAALVLSKDAFNEGSYCLMKFPATRERT
jgi:hypothetical protein